MRTYAKTIGLILLIVFLFNINSFHALELDKHLFDTQNDVLDLSLFPSNNMTTTVNRPNIDITNLSYVRSDGGREVEITLEVKGQIQNNGSLNEFQGREVIYTIIMETIEEEYHIEYINETCSLNGHSISFQTNGSILKILFSLYSKNETIISLEAFTTEFSINPFFDYFLDIIPNQFSFIALIQAPTYAETNESISFTGYYDDSPNISTPPYQYSWNWGDQSSETVGRNATHIFEKPGSYNVTFTIKDSSEYIARSIHQINIEYYHICDVNKDGNVNIQDIIEIWNHRNDNPIGSDYDVNNDEKINMVDILIVIKNQNQIELPDDSEEQDPKREFLFHISPINELMQPNIWYNINGYHQLQGTKIENILPNKWCWQYTFIELKMKPTWVEISHQETELLTKPDGIAYNFSIPLKVLDNAPAYEYGSIEFEVTTSKFICVQFPFLKQIIPEYSLDQSFQIQAGYVPTMEITNPLPIEMEPNSESIVNITIKNTGNARSIIRFECNMSEEDIEEGWGIQCSPPLYIDKNEEVDFSFTVFSPKIFGNIDVFLNCPIEINIFSVIEGPDGPTLNGTALINAHCVG